MEDDTLQLMADIEDISQVVGTEEIEFYYNPGSMSCPIDGCKPDLRFYSKNKWTRHWEEKHQPMNIKYICSVSGCPVECKRRTDMRAHIRMKHERDPDRSEFILSKREKQIKDNQGFIDPCFFVYKGKTIRANSTTTAAEPTATETLAEPTATETIAEPTATTTTEETMTTTTIEMTPMPAIGDSAPLVQTSSGQDTRTVEDSQTNSLGCCRKYLDIPPPPESVPELEQHIMWLCNVMDQAGRARELAKRKLEAMRAGEGERMEQERKRRREVEAENRELKRQIQDYKWRQTLFEE